jgi:hypothetical protein
VFLVLADVCRKHARKRLKAPTLGSSTIKRL